MTSVDLPEPDTPVTAVSTHSGTSTETSCRLCRETPRRCSQPCGVRGRCGRGARRGRTGTRLVADSSTCSSPATGPGVQHPSAALARARADVDHPVRPSYDVHVVLHDEQRVARRLEPVQHVQQRLRVGRVQARGGLVEHVDDPEQPRAQLGGDPQPLRLAGRQGGRAAPEAEVAQAEVEQHVDARDQVGADPDRDLGRLRRRRRRPSAGGQLRHGPQQRGDLGERQRVDLGDGPPGEGHRQRLRPQPAAVARRAGHAPHEPHRPLAHPLALGVGTARA